MKKLCQLFVIAAIGCFLVACGDTVGPPLKSTPVTTAPATLFPDASEIRLFADEDEFRERGERVSQRFRRGGERLTADEIARLRSTFRTVTSKPDPNAPVSACEFIPRHAFVFYNAKHRVQGVYLVCFGCGDTVTMYGPAFAGWDDAVISDIGVLKEIVQAHGMPTYENGY